MPEQVHRFTPAGAGHPRVRQFLKIKHNRGPTPPGAVALEGLWAIRHAQQTDATVEVLFVCHDLLRGPEAGEVVDGLARGGAIVLAVSGRVLGRMVDRDGPDGLAAIARHPPRRLTDIPVSADATVVVADGSELPGNLGTIIRTADGAGAAGVIVTNRRVRLSHPLLVKASMGTLFTLPVAQAEPANTLGWLQAHGFRVIAADPGAPVSYRDADYRGPVAVVVGNERHGLDPFWREAADLVVSIPMHGRADSLNVGHAAALLLYETLHHHRDA